jgi:hypothetical protein
VPSGPRSKLETNLVASVSTYLFDRIEPYGEDGKYKLVFSEKPKPIGRIPFAEAPSGSMQDLGIPPLTN